MAHPPSLGAFTETDAVRLFQSIPSLDSERQVFRGGSLLVMLRPARMLGLLSSPRRVSTGQPVYSRACSNKGLPPSKSAMTSRLSHPLPRQDLHLLACQRTKAAPSPRYLFVTDAAMATKAYWLQLGLQHFLGWTFLAASSVFTPRAWQDKTTGVNASGSSLWGFWRYGTPRGRLTLRRKLLAQDPI